MNCLVITQIHIIISARTTRAALAFRCVSKAELPSLTNMYSVPQKQLWQCETNIAQSLFIAHGSHIRKHRLTKTHQSYVESHEPIVPRSYADIAQVMVHLNKITMHLNIILFNSSIPIMCEHTLDIFLALALSPSARQLLNPQLESVKLLNLRNLFCNWYSH